ncbi:MAG TPA: hypothetical protein ENJ22_03170 [Gammaproteobacteria bacterium]|nr:hypothetical protein [Gammaproteobacteria bacterium]
MSGDNKTEILKRQWWEALEGQGAEVTWPDEAGEAALEEMLKLDGDLRYVPGLGLVCLRVSETPPGAWSVPDALLDRLASSESAWWLVLLVGRLSGEGAQGYILGDLSSPPVKNPPQSEGGVVSIQERRHLDSTRMILSIEKLAAILMRHRQHP